MARKGIEAEHLADLFEQLSRLLSAKSELSAALDVLQGGWESPSMDRLVAEIHTNTMQGQTLSAAIASYPQYFPRFLVDMVAEGERDEQLPEVLSECADYLRNFGRFAPGRSSTLRRTLIYPLLVLAMIVIVATLLMLFVIPYFEQLFNNFGMELPALTRGVITVANALTAFWPLLLGVLVLLFVLWRWGLRRSAPLQAFALRILLVLPGYSTLYRRANAALLLSTWGMLMGRGMKLHEAVAASSQLPLGPHIEGLLNGYGQALQRGEPLQQLLQQSPLFPPRMVQLAAVSGRIADPHELMLRQAENYASQIEQQRKSVAELQEAVLVLVAGVLVGTLVIAMYMPIFMLGQVI